MPSVSRNVAFVLLAALALVATGCGGSNNKGKIEGKWKITGGPGMEEKELKGMEILKAYPFMEFKADGIASFGIESSDPEMQKLLASGKDKTSFTMKYKLLSGDVVELYDLPKELQDKDGGPFGKKDRGKMRVKIEGDSMTISDDETLKDKPMKLTKVK